LFPDESGVGDEGGAGSVVFVVFVIFHDLSPVREVWVLRCGELRFATGLLACGSLHPLSGGI
jgi:hypothetical protein